MYGSSFFFPLGRIQVLFGRIVLRLGIVALPLFLFEILDWRERLGITCRFGHIYLMPNLDYQNRLFGLRAAFCAVPNPGLLVMLWFVADWIEVVDGG
jgi:hypothetical protein